ncbi:MAG: streptogramin lyase, partial [Myxococcota bacterium]
GIGASPAANVARALGVIPDQENKIHGWVGIWESQMLVQIEQEAGSIVDTISLPVNPYGLAIDQATGTIWISGRGGGKLVRVDPNTKIVTPFSPDANYSPYGIAIDEFGRPWTAHLGSGGDKVYMFDPNTTQWKSAAVPTRARGLVSNFDGRMFVACDQSHVVAVIDETTVTKIQEIALGAGRFPLGMAVDADGFVWAVNQQSGTIHKINGQTLAISGEHPVGTGPYTYSDMTGTAFFDAVPPGWYRHRFEAAHLGGVTGLAAMSNALWGELTIDFVAPPGAFLKFRVRTGTTIEEVESALWTPLVGPFPEQTFPVDLSTVIEQAGHFLEVEVWLYASEEGAKPLVKNFDIKYEAAP